MAAVPVGLPLRAGSGVSSASYLFNCQRTGEDEFVPSLLLAKKSAFPQPKS